MKIELHSYSVKVSPIQAALANGCFHVEAHINADEAKQLVIELARSLPESVRQSVLDEAFLGGQS